MKQYQSNPLASDSDDEKKLQKAELRAAQKKILRVLARRNSSMGILAVLILFSPMLYSHLGLKEQQGSVQ